MAVLDYDTLSICYDELYGEEQLRKYLDAYKRVKLSASSKILDVGCGTGLFLRFMRDMGQLCEYVGVDTSSGMLKKALERLDSMSHFVMADAHHLPFRGNIFTHLYCFTTIHHLNIERFVEEAIRVCFGSIIISQHKRLSPRLQTEACETGETDDEIIIKPSRVLRKASRGSGEYSLSRRGQTHQG